MTNSVHKPWVEINLPYLKNNIRIVKDIIGSCKEIIAVVKADAYGHGAVTIANYMARYGAAKLAVATAEEGIKLRLGGVKSPIIILGSIPLEEAEQVVGYNLTPMIATQALAERFNAIGKEKQRNIKFHIRVDIGLGTVGVAYQHAYRTIKLITDQYQWLKIEGLFTHLASTYGDDEELVNKDLEKFNSLISNLNNSGIHIPMIHAASSPATLKYPQAHFNTVRIGTCLYGLPSFKNQPEIGLKSIMQLKARITDIKELSNGQHLGYGNEVLVSKSGRIATVSIGYSNALFLVHMKSGEVLIRNQRTPLICSPFMGHILVDITNIPDASIGDEVVIFGEQGEEKITVSEVAKRAGISVTNCESVCFLRDSLPESILQEGIG